MPSARSGTVMVASGAASTLLWAALSCVRAAPLLLRGAPASDPVGEARVAIVRGGGGADRRAAVALTRAALAVVCAAPDLFRRGPTCLPIGEPICAIVWVRGRRGLCWLPANVVHAAAPLLLRCRPLEVLIHSAIERVSRRRRSGRRGGHHWREGTRWRWRGRGRRRRRW